MDTDFWAEPTRSRNSLLLLFDQPDMKQGSMASPNGLGNLSAGIVLVTLAASASAALGPMKNLPPDVAVRFDSARKTISRIEGASILRTLPDLAKRSEDDPGGAAIAFVSTYRAIFRLTEPDKELRVSATNSDELGFRHVKLSQVFRGLEVVPGEMLFHFNRDGALYLVSASYIPTPAISDIQPMLDKAGAVRAVAAAFAAKAGNWPAVLKIWSSPNGAALLAYEVAASVALDKSWRVFVDARSGKILDRISTIHSSSSLTPPRAPKPKEP